MKRYVIMAVAAGTLWGCGGSREQQGRGASQYNTMRVELSNCILRHEYTAKINGRQVVEVRPQVSGLITQIPLKEGQRVKKGQTLFVIDQTAYRAAAAEAAANVRSAEAQLATARLNLESTQQLWEAKVVQDYDLTAAKNSLAQAEAALAQAKAQEVNALNSLSYTEVKSPSDGVAGMINYRVGALVSSSISDPLVVIADNDGMYAYFSMSENYVLDLIDRHGSIDAFIAAAPQVDLRLSNGKAYAHAGHIAAVSGVVSTGTGAISLRADFPNPEGLLHEGASATVLIPTVRDSVIVVPKSATYEIQNKTFAYKVMDGKATGVEVTVTPASATEYIIESGLAPGDLIISEGAGLVREGAQVSCKL